MNLVSRFKRKNPCVSFVVNRRTSGKGSVKLAPCSVCSYPRAQVFPMEYTLANYLPATPPPSFPSQEQTLCNLSYINYTNGVLVNV